MVKPKSEIESQANGATSYQLMVQSKFLERRRVALARIDANARNSLVQPSKARIDRFLAALSVGVKVSAAAQYAGLAERTLYGYRSRHPEFGEAWEWAREMSCEPLEDALEEVAFNGSIDAMARVRAAETLLAARNRRYRKDAAGISAKIMRRDADGNEQTFSMKSGSNIPD